MIDSARQPDGLIQVLLNSKAQFGDRDDAAADLATFDDEAAENALARIASDPTSDEDLADTCGQSLAQIWCRRNRLSNEILRSLVPVSLQIAIATLRACSPALAAEAEKVTQASSAD